MPIIPDTNGLTLADLHQATAILNNVTLPEVTRDMLQETLTFQLRLHKYPVTRYGVNYAVAGRILGDDPATARQTSHNLATVAAGRILSDIYDRA